MEKYRVFINYSHEYRGLAERIVEGTEENEAAVARAGSAEWKTAW